MAIKGSLAEASLRDVIQLLSHSSKSGCLSVTDGRNFGNIFVKEGKIIHTTILNREQRLGDVLLLKKTIDNETLSRALEIQKTEKKKRLGEILIEIGALTKETLENELKTQAEQAISSMLTWESGYFNFEPDLLPSTEEYTIELSAQELLLEGAEKTEGILVEPEKELESKKAIGGISEYKNLGFAFYKTGMYDEAEREYKKILEIDSNDVEALFYLGLIELKRENYEGAREYLMRSSTQEKRATTLVNLGYVCSKLEFQDKAIDHLQQALDLPSENVKAKCNLGVVFYKKHDLEKSAKIFEEIIGKSPEVMTPYVYLPLVYAKQDNIEESAKLLNDAVDRFPRFSVFNNNLAVLYESADKPEEAEKLYRQALEADPQDNVVCKNLADFYYEAQILGAARELYERIPNDKRDWQILFKLGNICLRQGDSEKALDFWEHARQLNPLEEAITKNIEVLKKSGGE